MSEIVIVGIQRVPNPNHMCFHLREEVCKHLELGKRLFRLNGVAKDAPSDKFPLCMDFKGHYSFGITKGYLFDWEKEMLPKLKSEIEKYFFEKGKTVEFVEVAEMVC